MKGKRMMELGISVSLLIIAVPELPFDLHGVGGTFFSLMWLAGLFLNLTANILEMKRLLKKERKEKMIRQYFRMLELRKTLKHRQITGY
ncbi:hypothetical protein H1R82_09660 [Thermoactinomyces intermedius]|uniref:Uncharacterized protein n=1 Tax=Thermoactinomyces intermedius TaxID=2024 RepID=A0A8I1DED2_THEIN|nr:MULTISPECIES: hypothetical protein [Thermoactinomyces]MBA4549458.1 hypothetical protein [Thermoactinomyces intermedius]MBA4836891.1 hypothetical protein [Thermoactinomyces intermedius]MBH8594822.1 hypothetical protein [Thermoactinomyces intermedius]MBH8602301.1 hypothetical protein [Thermoactinomyces sp. CICC 23799]